MKKRLLIIGVAVCVLFTTVLIRIPGRATEPRTFTKGSYFTPSSSLYYVTEASIEQTPNTVEAWICLADDLKKIDRGGAICGNYNGKIRATMNVEVFTGYHPRALIIADNGDAQSYVFNKVLLPKGEFKHLAIVRDTLSGEIRCYINGECKQTLPLYGAQTVTINSAYGVGGDQRTGNPNCFRGEIHSVAFFSDKRTASEIDSDQYEVAADADALLASWSFEAFSSQSTIDDDAGNYDIVKDEEWFSDFDAGSYDYTIAVVGDTQRLNERSPESYPQLYNWLVDYRDANGNPLSIVLGLGDVTENGESWNAQWERAQAAGVALKAAKLPFTMIPGNHDMFSNSDNYFNQAFPVSLFNDAGYWGDKYYWGGNYEAGKTNNSYYNISVGGNEYLIFALEYGPRDKVMDWAGDIIRANPDKQVIITTHAYIWDDGRYVAPGDGALVSPPSKKFGYNDGDDVWEKLASKYENIRMVICGHISNELHLYQKTGKNGNTVTEIVCDFTKVDTPSINPNGAGMVFLLHFSDGGNHVQGEVVSAIRDLAGEASHYKREHQVSFDLDALDAD